MVPSNISISSWVAGIGCWYTSATLSISPLYYMHQLSLKSCCGEWYTFFIAHGRCRLLKGFTYDWNAKEKDVGFFFFFLIQMSSHMLSINKTDLPLTAPVINPFELLIIFFLLLSSVKGNTFFSSHNMVALLLLHENSKFLRILFGLTFTTWIL